MIRLILLAVALGTLLPVSSAAQTTWQQGVEYRMEARLDEEQETLEGFSRVRYRNNSPDTLTEFYFHLHLNAFRPNSAWARKDLEYGTRTFQDLGPREHGFERVHRVAVDGQRVVPFYPNAPDSTIMGIRLPEPLLPERSLSIDLRWDSRPSSVPRRQGREGRHYDFAQGYPRVVVYDLEGWRAHPLYRAGEFYGEFATYDVTLEIRDDQVVGATGVPVAGDPGWEEAAVPGTGPVDLQAEWYGSTSGPPCIQRGDDRTCGVYPARSLRAEEVLGHLGSEPRSGHRRIRWYAEDVHHFAWSTSPDYIYEQGSWEDVAIRVLYRPGDERTWGNGIAVRRTAVALAWLDSLFGDYPYPHVTNLHRLEGGGTEFPMVIMDGSASQGLILHEVGHIYAHGILANNEWYEGWLDEGMSSFQTSWFFEENEPGTDEWTEDKRDVLELELRGVAEPVVQNGEAYAEYDVYRDMVYTKGSLVFWMLREMVGDEAMRELLRTWYERYRFRHVTSQDFHAVAEEVLGMELDWFFAQWLHTNGTVEYGVDDVEVFDAGRGYWTRFRLKRNGEMRMPVPVRVSGLTQSKDTVVQGMDRERTVQVWTEFPPRRLELDPDGRILDWYPGNDAWARGLLRTPNRSFHLDQPARPPRSSLSTIPVGLFPLVWANDVGGWTAGFQARSSILGLSGTTLRVGLPGVEAGGKGEDWDGQDPGSAFLAWENPVRDGTLLSGISGEALLGEGRMAATFRMEKDLRRHRVSGRERSVRTELHLLRIYDEAYLPPGRWSPGERSLVEAGIGGRAGAGLGGAELLLDASGAGGFDTEDRRWARGTLSADLLVDLPAGWALATRAFGGVVWAQATADAGPDAGEWGTGYGPRERMFSLGSGDPFLRWGNPWMRSRGAGLTRTGRVAGGGTLPGFDARLPHPWLATVAVELGAPEFRLGLGSEVAFRPFVFAGVGWTELASPESVVLPEASETEFVQSAGMGFETGLRDSPVRIRVDLPIYVSEPAWASSARDEEVGLRVQLFFSPPGWN